MENLRNPRAYFKYAGCSRCFHTPCDQLRFGGVYPEKFILVHNSHIETGFFDCPFIAGKWSEIERLLDWATDAELRDKCNSLLQLLTPMERENLRRRLLPENNSDIAGKRLMIKTLWDAQVIRVIRIPSFFTSNEGMRQWLHAYESK